MPPIYEISEYLEFGFKPLEIRSWKLKPNAPKDIQDKFQKAKQITKEYLNHIPFSKKGRIEIW
jgi:hypothetical protein